MLSEIVFFFLVQRFWRTMTYHILLIRYFVIYLHFQLNESAIPKSFALSVSAPHEHFVSNACTGIDVIHIHRRLGFNYLITFVWFGYWNWE